MAVAAAKGGQRAIERGPGLAGREPSQKQRYEGYSEGGCCSDGHRYEIGLLVKFGDPWRRSSSCKKVQQFDWPIWNINGADTAREGTGHWPWDAPCERSQDEILSEGRHNACTHSCTLALCKIGRQDLQWERATVAVEAASSSSFSRFRFHSHIPDQVKWNLNPVNPRPTRATSITSITSTADRTGQSRPCSSTARPFPGRGALARSRDSKILHFVTSSPPNLTVGSRVLVGAQGATHHRRCRCCCCSTATGEE
ncbi:hypothetical protein B0T20DRAFT_490020 [Sordaria brevicollis]|uniref:Uncharacterized protein n=1 Tax=Sordaria brevicollis TaxID=83679 RepID=A0AAE0U2S7_SORBR|nr:hypothetical protein B0T20DRAFT_490020 [Sordaria brevicollis]